MDIIFETLDDLRTSSHHCDPDFQLRAYHLTYWASGCFRMQLNYTDIADILLYTFPCTVYCLYWIHGPQTIVAHLVLDIFNIVGNVEIKIIWNACCCNFCILLCVSLLNLWNSKIVYCIVVNKLWDGYATLVSIVYSIQHVVEICTGLNSCLHVTNVNTGWRITCCILRILKERASYFCM